MRLKVFLFALIAFSANSQTTYMSTKYKQVWYNSTYEKTHATLSAFDTSNFKVSWTTSGKPELKTIGPTGAVLFYVDSAGAIKTGTFPTYLLKADLDDSLNNAHTFAGPLTINQARNISVLSDGVYDLGSASAQFDSSFIEDGYFQNSVGIGTLTPLHKLSIVSSGGMANGLNVVNSTINVNRTSLAQARDSASVSGWVSTDGNGRLTLRAKDGDSLSFWGDGSAAYISANATMRIYVGTNYLLWNGTSFYPAATNKTLGTTASAFGKAVISDSVLTGGKGEDATIWWGQSKQLGTQATPDSCGTLTMINGGPAVVMASGSGLLLNFLGQRLPTYNASAWDFWFSTGGSTGTDTLWVSVDGTNAVPWLGGARVAKH